MRVESAEGNRLVFVYGSLLSGMGNHRVLIPEESSLVGTCKLSHLYTMWDLGGYPAVSEGGEGTIVGEVWSVSDTAWRQIERLEGYPSYYGRIRVSTPFGGAAMYTLERDYVGRYPVVHDGDWRRYITNRTLLRNSVG